ncbi:MAG TPA: hypothetical protein VKU44_02705 [Terriglobia bacterium]|nr:hypothetical protein [Terriglobia bacterium]
MLCLTLPVWRVRAALLACCLLVTVCLGVTLFAASYVGGARDGRVHTGASSSTWIAASGTGQSGDATIDPFEQ